MALRLLRIAAIVEVISLAVLLTNLATVHVPEVASLLGPVHGCAYLLVIGATFSLTRSAGARMLAVVPVAGGLLVLRRLSGAPAAG